MGKMIRKPIKGSWYNIGTIESWFSDMVKQGLMLRKLESRHAVFEETDRQEVEYRVKMFDFYPKDEGVIVEEHINDFDELGWSSLPYIKTHIFTEAKRMRAIRSCLSLKKKKGIGFRS